MTALARPSKYQPNACFSLVASPWISTNRVFAVPLISSISAHHDLHKDAPLPSPLPGRRLDGASQVCVTEYGSVEVWKWPLPPYFHTSTPPHFHTLTSQNPPPSTPG